jgi:prevent-host-death family protein
MRQVGIFEAKTTFTRLCDDVVRSGDSVVISKRGRPLVVISRADGVFADGRDDILTAWEKWKHRGTSAKGDFPEVWKMRSNRSANPLAE